MKSAEDGTYAAIMDLLVLPDIQFAVLRLGRLDGNHQTGPLAAKPEWGARGHQAGGFSARGSCGSSV
jgi:hypothetical protein